MARATGNDLCEIFGYAPDDKSEAARLQWKSQRCPFVGGVCVKGGTPKGSTVRVVYGSCSLANKTATGLEEVVICPRRLYANGYATLRACVHDAIGKDVPIYLASEYSSRKRKKTLPGDFVVLLGQNSGKEIALSNPDVIELSLDWVMARVVTGKLNLIIPCEVQSIDTTGNYHANWTAYSKELSKVPDSQHGMNWANVWKRLIPQIILKGLIASTSPKCKKGMYFIVPNRVYIQFEKLVGPVPAPDPAHPHDTLTVMTYDLGPAVRSGAMRALVNTRVARLRATGFAKAFGSGSQLPSGYQLDQKVAEALESL